MMDETLQKELSAHFKKINDRKEQLDKIEKSLNLKDTSLEEFKGEIEAEVTKHIKECLDKKKFDYEKGRNIQGDRITFQEGHLKIREFKRHSFSYVNVLTSEKLRAFLPNGLMEARGIIVEKLKEIENVVLEFKKNIKLKKAVTIQYVSSNKIEKEKIKDIEISFNCEEEHSSSNRNRYSYGSTSTYMSRNENFEIKLNGYTYRLDNALYSDEIFNNIISLINEFKERIKKVEHIREKKRNELREFTFNQVKKMMILGELKEE